MHLLPRQARDKHRENSKKSGVFAGGGKFGGKTEHCSGSNSHPALNGAMGCLPGDRYGVDRTIMNNTLCLLRSQLQYHATRCMPEIQNWMVAPFSVLR